MPYQLIPPDNEESGLFYRLDGEVAERHGAIGYMRADFGRSGREFWTTWFDTQKYLKIPAYKNEFDAVINTLRYGGEKPPFAGRANLTAFCAANGGYPLAGGAKGFKIQTLNYTHTFRCAPGLGDYDVRVFAFDNRYLLPELAGQHDLPQSCYSVLPSTGELILIHRDGGGYHPTAYQTGGRDTNRIFKDLKNAGIGVTRAQEQAMLAGSLFGWDKPAAKPWKYDMNGNARPPLPKKDAPER